MIRNVDGGHENEYWGIAILAVIAVFIGVYVAPMIPGTAFARRQSKSTQFSAPKAWGKIVGLESGVVVFEAGDGTIRFLNINYRIGSAGQVVLTIARN